MAVLMEDTSLEAERFLVQHWAQSSAARVRGQLCGAWKCGCLLAGREEPELDPFEVTAQVLEHLAALGVPYLVGGSVASSLYGEPRFTQDTDVEVWIEADQLEALLDLLKVDFYASREAALDGLRRRSSTNLIHFASQFKIDLFFSKNRPFDQSRMARRRQAEGLPSAFWVSSAEDMILAKLEWYLQGRQVSDRQWRDVLAMLAAQQGRLDQVYLELWAGHLKLTDLLQKALTEVQPLVGMGDGTEVAAGRDPEAEPE